MKNERNKENTESEYFMVLLSTNTKDDEEVEERCEKWLEI
jgi:hypothetical protein